MRFLKCHIYCKIDVYTPTPTHAELKGKKKQSCILCCTISPQASAQWDPQQSCQVQWFPSTDSVALSEGSALNLNWRETTSPALKKLCNLIFHCTFSNLPFLCSFGSHCFVSLHESNILMLRLFEEKWVFDDERWEIMAACHPTDLITVKCQLIW